MLEHKMDASIYNRKEEIYYGEFEDILRKITLCYLMLRKDNRQVPLNDENGIRDILLRDYLKNQIIKKKVCLTDYLFDRETSEEVSDGRVDIRVMPVNPLVSDEAYYIFECKRLDSKALRGTSGLNSEYIKNGIQRFTSSYYSSYYFANGMIGFVVEAINIKENIDNINYLLENEYDDINTTKYLTRESFIDNFEYHYSSIHTTKDDEELILYHLMFDFTY